MRYVRDNVKSVAVPRIYAYEELGSEQAKALGAPYMLIEGFYGNTIQDIEVSVQNLPVCPSKCVPCLG